MRATTALTAAALAAGLAGTFTSPSQAATGTCYIDLPPRVYVDAPKEWVRAHFSPSCEAQNARAKWDAKDPAGYTKDYWRYDSDGSSVRRSMSFEDGQRLGRWKASASYALNQADGSKLDQDYDFTNIRLRSLLSISGTSYDPGTKVQIRGVAKRYSPAVNTYRPWAGVTVRLYVRADPSSPWSYKGSAKAVADGSVTFNTSAPDGYDFQLRTMSSSNTWGKYSKYVSE